MLFPSMSLFICAVVISCEVCDGASNVDGIAWCKGGVATGMVYSGVGFGLITRPPLREVLRAGMGIGVTTGAFPSRCGADVVTATATDAVVSIAVVVAQIVVVVLAAVVVVVVISVSTGLRGIGVG